MSDMTTVFQTTSQPMTQLISDFTDAKKCAVTPTYYGWPTGDSTSSSDHRMGMDMLATEESGKENHNITLRT